jgi:serine/threonine protein kinase
VSVGRFGSFGQADGLYFLIMEFVDGVSPRQAMKAGRFTPEQALAIVPPVCEALQYAHHHRLALVPIPCREHNRPSRGCEEFGFARDFRCRHGVVVL